MPSVSAAPGCGCPVHISEETRVASQHNVPPCGVSPALSVRRCVPAIGGWFRAGFRQVYNVGSAGRVGMYANRLLSSGGRVESCNPSQGRYQGRTFLDRNPQPQQPNLVTLKPETPAIPCLYPKPQSTFTHLQTLHLSLRAPKPKNNINSEPTQCQDKVDPNSLQILSLNREGCSDWGEGLRPLQSTSGQPILQRHSSAGDPANLWTGQCMYGTGW